MTGPEDGWFARDPSKAQAEKYFLVSTFATLAMFLLGVISSGLYRHCGRNEFLVISFTMAAVPAGAGLLHEPDASRAWTERFWVKAFAWNAVFGFIGNYMWTHYFYTLLGARYTFDSYWLNGVPWPCYLATQAYFCFYHTVTSVALRRVRFWTRGFGAPARRMWMTLAVLALAYVTALGETLTISAFPFYDFTDRSRMYSVGSVFYALYFVVSFPMYLRIDEHELDNRGAAGAPAGSPCDEKLKPRYVLNFFSLGQAVLDSFAAAMMVTMLLDFWRLSSPSGRDERASRGLAEVGVSGMGADAVAVEQRAQVGASEAHSRVEFHENQWRSAMASVCAGMMERSVQELEELYEKESEAMAQMGGRRMLRFAQYHHQPEDAADFIIMMTLQTLETFSLQNAPSWFFNVMDRNGCGTVHEPEFLRYASIMYPLCDPAVAKYIWNMLMEAQRQEDAAEAAKTKAVASGSTGKDASRSEAMLPVAADDQDEHVSTPSLVTSQSSPPAISQTQHKRNSSTLSVSSMKSTASAAVSYAEPGRGLTSTVKARSTGFKFKVWKKYVTEMKANYDAFEVEWENTKSALFLDPLEPLIFSFTAIDHSEMIPSLGRLFLSERYLVFTAGVGARNYVIRLGNISEIKPTWLSFTMRDCIEIHVEPELKSALKADGGVAAVTSTQSSETQLASSSSSEPCAYAIAAAALVKSYSISGDPILFSFPELGDSRMRDTWLRFIREMVTAYKLHNNYGFGSKGRPPAHDSPWTDDAARSPYRNDVPPPLLSVAAGLNIIRTKSLQAVLGRPSWLLLIFSDLGEHENVAKYYVDSIRNVTTKEHSSWVSRTVLTIKENMQINSRLADVYEEEPFEVQKLGEAIIRFWELIQPAIQAYELYDSIKQWKNPPATVLAMLICSFIAYRNWVMYIPSLLLFLYMALILGVRVRLVGVRGSDAEAARASKKARSTMLEFVKSVHDALQAAQNLISRWNRMLGKMESLQLWAVPWMTWVLLSLVFVTAILLLLIPARWIFVAFILDTFSQFFRYPVGAADQFWADIPVLSSSSKPKAKAKSQ
ncbi:Cycloeucalenol cycloisomerase [Porphyridium purpureum]|uniref:Cycloeucalenol cycloisomerase n=1 Tax=Porphyridium purpureum TaxID=35688 RepID=A0A5J4Z1A8_PORPP|nr:Cycloeucalenol cycloisomerase [Porphyridium purpureum]|eukprot:POR0244..scf208_2